jgi:hypothetical protein
VSRLSTNATQRSLTLTLDFANELIEFKPSEHFTLTLAKSLHDDGDDEDMTAGALAGDDTGKKTAKREMWRGGDEGLAEEYEYVMYGKVSHTCPQSRSIVTSTNSVAYPSHTLDRFTNSMNREVEKIRRECTRF